MAKLGAKNIVNGLEFKVEAGITDRNKKCFTLEGYEEVLLENFPRATAPVPIEVRAGDHLVIVDAPRVRPEIDGSLIIVWENRRTSKRSLCYWDHFRNHTEHIPNNVSPKAKKQVEILSTGPFEGLDIAVDYCEIDDAWTHTPDKVETLYLTFTFPGEMIGARWISEPMLNKMKKNPYFKTKIMQEVRTRLEEAEKTHTFFQSTSDTNSDYTGKYGTYKRILADFRSGGFNISFALVNSPGDVMKYLEIYLDYTIKQRGLARHFPDNK